MECPTDGGSLVYSEPLHEALRDIMTELTSFLGLDEHDWLDYVAPYVNALRRGEVRERIEMDRARRAAVSK